MWDRFLIKCDWLFTLESKKQISLWYVYKVQNHLVQRILPPPPPPNYFEEKKCVIYFVHLCTSKKTF